MSEKYYNDLHQAILTRTDRMNAIERIANDIEARAKSMTLSEKLNAIQEVRSMRKEVESEKKELARMNREWRSHYAPAVA